MKVVNHTVKLRKCNVGFTFLLSKFIYWHFIACDNLEYKINTLLFLRRLLGLQNTHLDWINTSLPIKCIDKKITGQFDKDIFTVFYIVKGNTNLSLSFVDLQRLNEFCKWADGPVFSNWSG